MGDLEFIIALTEHRFLGKVFQPFLIRKKEKFYSVVRLIKPHDFEGSEYQWKPYEKELVNIIERYSDERLLKKFSRAGSVASFYSSLDTGIFERQVIPFIEKSMMEVVSILMLSPVRLLQKESKYANLYDEDEILVPPVYARPEFSFERTETQTRYQLKVFLNNKEVMLSNRTCTIVTNDPCLLLYRNQLLAFEKLNAKKLVPFFEKDFVSVPNTIEEKYYSGFILKTIRDFDVKANGFYIRGEEADKFAELSLETNLQMQPVLVLQFWYGKEKFAPTSTKRTAVTLQKEGGSFVFYKTNRDRDWENRVVSKLSETDLLQKDGCTIV